MCTSLTPEYNVATGHMFVILFTFHLHERERGVDEGMATFIKGTANEEDPIFYRLPYQLPIELSC